MALLFPREEDKDFAATTDAATRSLSAISLETSFVEGVYEKMASVYDLFFGLPGASTDGGEFAGKPVATFHRMEIWHNPRCSKSRAAKQRLDDEGIVEVGRPRGTEGPEPAGGEGEGGPGAARRAVPAAGALR